jgi:thymidylate kinase
MNSLLSKVFEVLQQNNIRYCLLRDGERLSQKGWGGEIDLLVDPEQFDLLRQTLAKLGFIPLPNLGHAPHHFFLSYDPIIDTWLKLDIVNELAFGRPIRFLGTSLAENCLDHRRRLGPTFIPSSEDELITLLLHCVLDKGYFSETRKHRLKELQTQNVDAVYLSQLLKEYWSSTAQWEWLNDVMEQDDWDVLLFEQDEVVTHLKSRNKFGALFKVVSAKILRKVSKSISWLSGMSGVSLALLAPDGAGKSTLSKVIERSFFFPVHQFYMGLYPRENESKPPIKVAGYGFAMRFLRVWMHYLTAKYFLALGHFVVFDRYTYDALLPACQQLNWKKELKRYLLAHLLPAPDLVVVLDAPAEQLFARKGEHSVQVLENQRQGYLQLKSHLPQVTMVDASREIDSIRREVTSLIWRRYTQKLRSH